MATTFNLQIKLHTHFSTFDRSNQEIINPNICKSFKGKPLTPKLHKILGQGKKTKKT